MSDTFELRITDVSEIEAVELQNEIDQHLEVPIEANLATERLPQGVAGDPGLAHVLLTYGPQVVSSLAGAIAVWLAAGKKRKVSQARRLVITRNGILYSNVKISDIEQDASGKPLEEALAKLLEGPASKAAK